MQSLLEKRRACQAQRPEVPKSKGTDKEFQAGLVELLPRVLERIEVVQDSVLHAKKFQKPEAHYRMNIDPLVQACIMISGKHRSIRSSGIGNLDPALRPDVIML